MKLRSGGKLYAVLNDRFDGDMDKFKEYAMSKSLTEISIEFNVHKGIISIIRSKIAGGSQNLFIERCKLFPKVCGNLKLGTFKNNDEDVLWCIQMLKDTDANSIDYKLAGRNIQILGLDKGRIRRVMDEWS
jgi:hypothetical protein